MSIIDELSNYRKGHFLVNLTTNKKISDKDVSLYNTTIKPIATHNSDYYFKTKISKIYYHIYFLEDNDIFKISTLNKLNNETIKDCSLLHQLFYNSISKNYCEIIEAGSKKKIYVADNVSFSGLDIKNIDFTKLSLFKDTSVLKDGSIIKNSIFLPSIVNTLLDSKEFNSNSNTNINSNLDQVTENNVDFSTAAGKSPYLFIDFKNLETKKHTTSLNFYVDSDSIDLKNSNQINRIGEYSKKSNNILKLKNSDSYSADLDHSN